MEQGKESDCQPEKNPEAAHESGEDKDRQKG
jgi:hypothetical protein